MSSPAVRGALARMVALVLFVPAVSAAVCLEVPGDLDGSGEVSVIDAQCAILAALSEIGGEPAPACLAPTAGGAEASVGDIDCDGTTTVGDVVVVIQLALGFALPAEVDANGDGCADGCEPVVVECPAVPLPPDVGHSPLPPMAPAGPVETVNAGGFTDDYLLDGTQAIKIGTRREWGCTVVFYGLAGSTPGSNATNTIDANDTGREVQIALYDGSRIKQGCAWNASCFTAPETQCPNSITYLGWNPVQGGNECNNGSPIESIDAAPGVLECVVRPRHWNPDWQEPTCVNGGCGSAAKQEQTDIRYTQRLRFITPHVVEMEMIVENLVDLDHPVALQELPTVYAVFGKNGTANLNRLMMPSGTEVSIDQPANDGFFVKQFVSDGPWVTLQNAALDYGVGIYYENRLAEFQGWQKPGVFNNTRAVFPFEIPAFATVRARAYLLLGSFDTISAEASQLDATLPPFGSVESPVSDQVVGTLVEVSGWALDNKETTSVEVRLDGEPIATLTTDVDRPDVCALYPGYAECPGAGFEAVVALPEGTTACAHTLEFVGFDADGNSRLLGAKRISVTEGPLCANDAACDDGDPCTVDTCVPELGCSFGPTPADQLEPESCDGVDNDCDNEVDEAGAVGCTDYYEDADEDSYGVGGPLCLCEPEAPYTAQITGDCNDDAPAVSPAGTEVCNGQDDNCADGVDEGLSCDPLVTVHRFYWSNGSNNVDHRFSTSDAPLGGGYAYEGASFSLFVGPGPGRVPLYQVYCPGCVDHMLTLDPNEGAPAYGNPTLLGYCQTSSTPDAPKHLRRLWNASVSNHLSSTSPGEWAAAQAGGYVLESGCYVP